MSNSAKVIANNSLINEDKKEESKFITEFIKAIKVGLKQGRELNKSKSKKRKITETAIAIIMCAGGILLFSLRMGGII